MTTPPGKELRYMLNDANWADRAKKIATTISIANRSGYPLRKRERARASVKDIEAAPIPRKDAIGMLQNNMIAIANN